MRAWPLIDLTSLDKRSERAEAMIGAEREGRTCRGKLEAMILSSSYPAWFWVLAAFALVAYALPALLKAPKPQAVATSLALAWVSHGLVLAISLFSGRFGFGPALSVMAWLVLTVYAVESRLYPQMQSRRALAALGGVALLIGLVFPGTALHAKASIWLPLHGAFGVAAYGLLAVATVHAWLMRRAEAQMRVAPGNAEASVGLPLMTLERLMMGFVLASFVLLTGTLLAGWFFGEDLYGAGNAWRWNHKTIFSVLAWGAMGLLLLGRWQWGWRGKRAARFVYGSALLLLLAYVGSRFVLEVLLQRTV
jgi:ABC-type uncharacterized transport system permease subunit